jgi:hypothetical protein
MKNQNINDYHNKISTNKLFKNKEQYNDELNKETESVIEKYPDLKPFLTEKEPAFVKLYIDQLASIAGMSKPSTDFFNAIISEGFVSIKGYVELNTKKKKHLFYNILKLKDKSSGGMSRIMTALNVPNAALNNTPVLIPVPNGELDSDDIEKYYINPLLVGNGNWSNIRNRRIRIILDYQDDGQKMTIENLEKLENFNTKTEAYCKNETNKKVISVSENTGAFFDENDVDLKDLFENEN